MDLINGQPTGCVRISFGYMSTIGDADAFIQFVADNFIDKTIVSSAPSLSSPCRDAPAVSWTVAHIYLYPVKSAGALEVSSWKLGRRGLKYDRQWMVVTEAGVCVSQKRAAHMCLLQPAIDECAATLTLSYPGIPLKEALFDS